MASFFEKLKKGMGVEEEINKKEIIEEKEKEIPAKKSKKTRVKKEKVPKKEKAEIKIEKILIKEKEEPEKKIIMEETKISNSQKIEKPSISVNAEPEKKYEGPAGQLAVDVYQTEKELVIQSAIAGVKADSLDISFERDVISISGIREKPSEDREKVYIYQECYWGHFSRQIMVSVEVDPSRTEATLKDGILTIRVPKIDKEKKRKITVKE
ncbi:Hsp20/alpha crystallin family protein [Patescibacteria group bacterium]